jgi:hypothetical protein
MSDEITELKRRLAELEAKQAPTQANTRPRRVGGFPAIVRGVFALIVVFGIIGWITSKDHHELPDAATPATFSHPYSKTTSTDNKTTSTEIIASANYSKMPCGDFGLRQVVRR